MTARRLALGLAALLATPAGFAQDADVDAAVDDAATGDAPTASAPAPDASASSCASDPIAADRAPTVTVMIAPVQPRVGDRVLITYRFNYRGRDRVEFDPDVVAYQQPAVEMEYAREQPERDRSARPAGGGRVTTDVVVAAQPFKVADVVIPAQHARVNTGDEIARFCTPEVRFRVRDVYGNDPHPRARDITAPAEVRVGALTMRYVALGADLVFGVVVATLGASVWWKRRPRKVAPPPPPRHPYLVAREGLEELAHGDLLTRGHTKEYYDLLSDVMRRYLGGVRGFDAIEMTTHEILTLLRPNPLPGVPMVEVENLLGECDLVKFAKYVPSHEEADEVLKAAVSIVERGRPVVQPAQGATAETGGRP